MRKFKTFIVQKYVECLIFFDDYYPLQRTFTSVIQWHTAGLKSLTPVIFSCIFWIIHQTSSLLGDITSAIMKIIFNIPINTWQKCHHGISGHWCRSGSMCATWRRGSAPWPYSATHPPWQNTRLRQKLLNLLRVAQKHNTQLQIQNSWCPKNIKLLTKYLVCHRIFKNCYNGFLKSQHPMSLHPCPWKLETMTFDIESIIYFETPCW